MSAPKNGAEGVTMRRQHVGGNMRKRLGRTVGTQKTREVNGNTQSYERWIAYHAPKDEYGEAVEPSQANPDTLLESDGVYANSQPTPEQMLMGEAVEHLQGRQKQVYLMMMREGLSGAQAAMKLGISKWTARDYRDRANRFIVQYCDRHKARLYDENH